MQEACRSDGLQDFFPSERVTEIDFVVEDDDIGNRQTVTVEILRMTQIELLEDFFQNQVLVLGSRLGFSDIHFLVILNVEATTIFVEAVPRHEHLAVVANGVAFKVEL